MSATLIGILGDLFAGERAADHCLPTNLTINEKKDKWKGGKTPVQGLVGHEAQLMLNIT